MVAYVHGENEAFTQLFHRYAPRLRRVLSFQVGVRTEVDDLVQQTFLQVHRARRDFDANQLFRPWIFTILLNLRRELYRKRKRRPEVAIADVMEPRTEARTEAELALEMALTRLPLAQREVIVLHWFGGLSFSQVAEVVGARTAAVKVRAHRGYVDLRRILDEAHERPHPGNPKPGAGIYLAPTETRNGS